MSELYNEKLKEAFLNSYDNENTRKTIKNVFVKSARTEESLGKDLYEFNLDEIKSVLYDMNSSTKLSAKTNGRFIEYYLDWTIENGYKANLSPLEGILPSFYEQFATRKKIFFTEDEILKMERNLVNAQDKVVLRAAFIGIKIEELLNLTKKDVNSNSNTLKLHDGDNERELVVDKETMDIIIAAMKEDTYQLKNGQSLGKRRVSNLVENDYVIKTVEGKAINVEKASNALIYRRLALVSEWFGYRYLNYGNVLRSGMLKWAKDHYPQYGEINKVLLSNLGEHFGMNKINYNGKPDYNYTAIKEHVNEENLMDLYPELFE